MRAFLELEALPPDLRDLTQSCHPRWPVGAGLHCPKPGLAEVSAQVASLQSLILCSGQDKFRQLRLLSQKK